MFLSQSMRIVSNNMDKLVVRVTAFWSWLWIIQTVIGDYDVSVRLLEYTRDEDCGCDKAFLWGSCYECDVYFQICLQPLSPTQGQICQGNNQDYLVDDTHHFLFGGALRGHDTYRWRNVNGQPTFQIAVHAFDYDNTGGNDDLGVTSYTYRGNRPTVQTVTTNPGNRNMRIKLTMNVTYSSAQSESTMTSKTNSYRTTTTTPTTTYTTTAIPYKNYNNHPLQNHKTTTTIPYTTTTTPFTPTIYRKTINTPTTTPHTLPKLTTSKVCSETTLADYDVSVRLLEYNRDQDCTCDGGFTLWGCRECDVYFQICLQPLSPTQGQICQGNNQDDRVNDTHHFLFADALKGHDTYRWRNLGGQPSFQISVHAFDYDSGLFDDNDDLGVTSYTYRGNRPTVQTVTTNPGNKNMRIKLTMNVTYSSAQSGSTTTSKTNRYKTTTTTPTAATTYKTTTTTPTTATTYTTTTTPFTPFTTTIYRKTINTPTTTLHTLTKLTTSRVCSETTGGDYDVSVRLLEYTRDQDCGCDGGLWGCYECDVFFQICLQPLSPTQSQICQGNNQDDRVNDTHHFLFADVFKRGHDTYRWRNIGDQLSFEISVHVFDYDDIGGNDDLGVTSYTYTGNRPTVQTVTTTPGNKNMRLKLLLNVSCSSNNGGLTSPTPPTVHSTLLSTETQNMTRDYTSSMTSTSNCADLHDSCSEFDLVYGICKATPHDSPLLYKQALEECKRTCRFC